MADSQFVSKKRFIAFIKDVIGTKQTGLVSILTDSKRSVLLKFSQGVLIHAYSRTRDIGDVIQVINETDLIKFDIVPIPPEDGVELMPGEVLMQLLESGASNDTTQSIVNAQRKVSPDASSKNPDLIAVRELLESVAAEYVGMVAEVIVEEALAASGSIEEAIDNIAGSIPDPGQSAAFRAEARKQTRLVSM